MNWTKNEIVKATAEYPHLTEYIRTIFVYGSNNQGIPGAGAALEAAKKWGARRGMPCGLVGNSYGIITKDLRYGKRSVSLHFIESQVLELRHYVKDYNKWLWKITAIGCGLAGFRPEEIAPMFKDFPPNAELPEIFKKILVPGG